jgi:hypothetical protein
MFDEYVSISNTNVHLRAGLGKGGRVLVPYPPEWRWAGDGDVSPWFTGFTAYRQATDLNWDRPFERLAADLERTTPAAPHLPLLEEEGK